MRDRLLLAAAAFLVLAGSLAAVTKGDGHVGPAACAKRVARALHLDAVTDATVSEDDEMWTAMIPTGRLVVRVTGERNRVTGVEALAGPGADVLERPERLRALAVRC